MRAPGHHLLFPNTPRPWRHSLSPPAIVHDRSSSKGRPRPGTNEMAHAACGKAPRLRALSCDTHKHCCAVTLTNDRAGCWWIYGLTLLKISIVQTFELFMQVEVTLCDGLTPRTEVFQCVLRLALLGMACVVIILITSLTHMADIGLSCRGLLHPSLSQSFVRPLF